MRSITHLICIQSGKNEIYCFTRYGQIDFYHVLLQMQRRLSQQHLGVCTRDRPYRAPRAYSFPRRGPDATRQLVFAGRTWGLEVTAVEVEKIDAREDGEEAAKQRHGLHLVSHVEALEESKRSRQDCGCKCDEVYRTDAGNGVSEEKDKLRVDAVFRAYMDCGKTLRALLK